MQTIIQETGASLMAQWRTTGGAMGAAVGEPATGDDGLQASSPITGAYCTFGDPRLAACEPSFSRMCFVEDGLKATGPTQSYHQCQGVDEGLAAGNPTAQVWCHVDDGLKATGPTQSWQRCF